MRLKNRLYIIFILLLPLLSINISSFAQDKNGVDTLLVKALLKYNQNQLDSAKESFSTLIKENPNNDAGYYYLANIALKERDITSCEIYLKKAISLDSANYWYKNRLGEIYYQTNKVDEAINIYEALVKEFPKKIESYYNLVNLYMAKQNLVEAGETLDKIEKIGGVNEGIAITRYKIYRMEQNWEGALNYLVEADNQIQSPNLEAIIGDMYSERFKDTLALTYYNKALTSAPSYAPALFGRAELHRLSGRYQEFFSDIIPFFANSEVSTQMKSDYIKQLFQIPGFAQRYKSQTDSIFNNIEAAHPTDSTALYMVAAYNSQNGNREKATATLKRITAAYPTSYKVLMEYLSYLYHNKEWALLESEIENSLNDSLIIDNNEANRTNLIQLKGIALYQQDKIDEAIKSYKELESIAHKSRDTSVIVAAYTLLGDLHSELNDKPKAYSYYKSVLKYDPNNVAVLNNYAYYLSMEGKKLKLAYQMSEKCVKAEPDNPTYLDTFGWILFLLDRPLEAKAQFKHAMLYGGKESATILDHYAEVLFALKEYDLAFIYWEQAANIDNSLNIKEKVELRKAQIKDEK